MGLLKVFGELFGMTSESAEADPQTTHPAQNGQKKNGNGHIGKGRVYKPQCQLTLFLLASVLLIIVCDLHFGGVSTAMTAMAVATACFAAGGGVGFLFGVPRTRRNKNAEEEQALEPEPDQDGEVQAERAPLPPSKKNDSNNGRPRQLPYKQRPNTNLEEISDWLTKIIVGVTLVQLPNLENRFNTLTDNIADGLAQSGGDFESHRVLAGAILVSFTTFGFFFGYLGTRNILAYTFSSIDWLIETFGTKKEVGEMVKQSFSEHGEVDVLVNAAYRTIGHYKDTKKKAKKINAKMSRSTAEEFADAKKEMQQTFISLEQAINRDKDYIPSRLALASWHYAQDNYRDAIVVTREAMKIDALPRVKYNLACYLITQATQPTTPPGEKESLSKEAFGYLHQVVQNKDDKFDQIADLDSDWDQVRHTPEFQQAMGRPTT